MQCPFCHDYNTKVTNSRSTRGAAQIWRRRKCLSCDEIFTTHEIMDLSHVLVIKKSGMNEMYSRMKVYSGIFYASQGSRLMQRELFVDRITCDVEKDILALKQKKIAAEDIARIILTHLKRKHTPSFLRYLTNFCNIKSEDQMKEAMEEYV